MVTQNGAEGQEIGILFWGVLTLNRNSECFHDQREVDEAQEDHIEFLEAREDAAEALQSAKEPLDLIAFAVQGLVRLPSTLQRDRLIANSSQLGGGQRTGNNGHSVLDWFSQNEMPLGSAGQEGRDMPRSNYGQCPNSGRARKRRIFSRRW